MPCTLGLVGSQGSRDRLGMRRAGVDTPYPQVFVWEASRYLVHLVFKSLREMFSGTRTIQVCPCAVTLPGTALSSGGWPKLVPVSAALADPECTANLPGGLSCGVGDAPRYPHHPALSSGVQAGGE